ncbi:MAG: hypothetical protein ABTQ34_06985 [Bdellovibrionales bacterium]
MSEVLIIDIETRVGDMKKFLCENEYSLSPDGKYQKGGVLVTVSTPAEVYAKRLNGHFDAVVFGDKVSLEPAAIDCSAPTLAKALLDVNPQAQIFAYGSKHAIYALLLADKLGISGTQKMINSIPGGQYLLAAFDKLGAQEPAPHAPSSPVPSVQQAAVLGRN